MLETISAAHLPSATTRLSDVRHLSNDLDECPFSHVFHTFVLQSITAPFDALREVHAVLAPNIVSGVAFWAQRNSHFEIWDAVCRSIEPAYGLPALFGDPGAW